MSEIHKRRLRYSGTHPKSFDKKYKELDPEHNKETIQKIIDKGMTPAGTHRPICVHEILEFLDIKPNQIGLDATLGYGGHALEILNVLNHTGHLHATDQDPIELARTKERLHRLGYNDKDFSAHHLNFSDTDMLALEYGPFDFVIADLGVSSMQIDNPSRGFSFKTSSPLDLRMDPTKGMPAREHLKILTKDELTGILIEYADEPYAVEISKAVTDYLMKGKDISLTSELFDIISHALRFIKSPTKEEDIKKSAQRTFQALRIHINLEYEVLYAFLEHLPKVLKPNGKVAILTFHSGEDRLVKKSFQHYFRDHTFSFISDGPIRPSMEEQSSNSRSRSAKLRFAIKHV